MTSCSLTCSAPIFSGFQPGGKTAGVLESTVDIDYGDVAPDKVDMGDPQSALASFIDGAEEAGMLIDERFYVHRAAAR